jgi:hypothetical protein
MKYLTSSFFSSFIALVGNSASNENNKSEGMWEQAGGTWFKVLFQNLLQELRKTRIMQIRIVGVPAEIRSRHLPNKSQKRFH